LGVNSLTLADEPAHIWGGVIARRDAVRQMVDNSWNERLALARRVLRDQVYRQLTSDEQPE